ncbi:LAGLIDADG family homing endonuclease [Kitasatospora sp. GAS204B]|uniref:LAGLIDADG family homing endonuclease n=1 Tax=unclassified Kitasatospora TaxID=2633591 RepID=UPI002472F7A7|nr:LAGLIDADG family homing endonuclease [Kitasatospora sp. GAS204B]MDH6121687.1 hypothetical protein [Kitasatospora sp. GAS204B]
MAYIDLQNPDHAYAFGFLQADGHLSEQSRNRGRLAVELAARDAPLLEAFQRLFPVKSSIGYRTRTTNFSARSDTATWTVWALEFRQEIRALGLPVGRKSQSIAPPQAPHSEPDYLRGLIDADGSIGRTAQDLPFVSLTTASDAIIWYFSNYVRQLTGTVHTPNRNQRDQIYNLMYTIEDAVELARTLYYPGCLALPRKLAASEHVMGWTRPPGSRRVRRQTWTAEQDQILLGAATITQAAAALDRSEQSCAMRRWRLLGPARPRVRFPSPRSEVSP